MPCLLLLQINCQKGHMCSAVLWRRWNQKSIHWLTQLLSQCQGCPGQLKTFLLLRSFTSLRWGTMFEQGSLWWGLLLFCQDEELWILKLVSAFSRWITFNAFEVWYFFSMTNTLFLGWTLNSSTASYFPPWNTSDDSAPILAIKSTNFSSQL